MKKRALRKEFYMEIRRTLNRFLSLFLITALGVAFFAGIRATQPDMELSADAAYDEQKLMDIRVVGTLGVTAADAEALSEVEGVSEVMPCYQTDMFCLLEDNQINVQVMSMPDGMNLLTLEEGRFPENKNECLADKKLIDNEVCHIGETVTLKSGTDTDTEEILGETEFTITGAVSSPLYLSLERGTTGIGNGTLDGFLVLDESAFAMDYYTQICVRVEGADELNCYSDEYDELVSLVEERIEDISGERCEIRYLSI